MTATLYGIGIGPGDSELITVKARNRLRQCAVVAYPAAVGQDSLALQIAETHLHSDSHRLRLDIPMTREPAQVEAAYDQAAERIADQLNAGKTLGYICEGDPLFYGSFIPIMQRLRPRFAIEIIPGVSSIMAGAGVFLQPLVEGNQHLRILPGTLEAATLKQQLATAERAVIMKVGRHFRKICTVLRELNRFETSYYVAYATMDQQTHRPLPEVKDSQIPYFSLIYVL